MAKLAVFRSAEFGEATLPLPEPLPEAVEAGVFCDAITGCGTPNQTQIRALTEEHARELWSLLHDLAFLTECASRGLSPSSGRPFPTQAKYETTYLAMNLEAHRLTEHYRDLLEAYASGFGHDAAEALDRSLIQLVDRPIEVPLPRRVGILQRELLKRECAAVFLKEPRARQVWATSNS
ncbi:hypothetical protein [Bythopirellula goksoeyrii]|uniref:hypothetical protein n=1 Tax=Bythopirellula goksoeyrii TaxID=1400387 RepID=UPI0011CDC963|nr:hypothetical protein [Bythopirellula goksoeyrii]